VVKSNDKLTVNYFPFFETVEVVEDLPVGAGDTGARPRSPSPLEQLIKLRLLQKLCRQLSDRKKQGRREGKEG